MTWCPQLGRTAAAPASARAAGPGWRRACLDADPSHCHPNAVLLVSGVSPRHHHILSLERIRCDTRMPGHTSDRHEEHTVGVTWSRRDPEAVPASGGVSTHAQQLVSLRVRVLHAAAGGKARASPSSGTAGRSRRFMEPETWLVTLPLYKIWTGRLLFWLPILLAVATTHCGFDLCWPSCRTRPNERRASLPPRCPLEPPPPVRHFDHGLQAESIAWPPRLLH